MGQTLIKYVSHSGDIFTYTTIDRVLSPCKTGTDDAFVLIPLMIQTYPAAYQAFSDAKPVTCTMTGRVFDAISAPDIVFLDVGIRASI